MSYKSLHLDKNAVFEALKEEFRKGADRLAAQYFAEIQGGMHTERGRGDLSLDEDETGEIIRRLVIGKAFAIMDSYGTGSKMDTDNDALEMYKNSKLWNPARRDSAIRGRPAGTYTNIFGNDVKSSGALSGINLEKMKGSPIKPIEPSGAFQDAESFLIAEGRLEKECAAIVKEFFKAGNMKRFWRFG